MPRLEYVTNKHRRAPLVVLVCGSLILTIALGVRHGFGLFLRPMSVDLGCGRESFAFALAVQNAHPRAAAGAGGGVAMMPRSKRKNVTQGEMTAVTATMEKI